MILNTPDYQAAIDLIQETIDAGGLKSKDKLELIFRKAGLIAEKQMAFLLQSFFEKRDDVLVINNLKITHNTGAQIDHLILGTVNMFYIESKSISDTLHVNEYGDWVRIYKGTKTGIVSPVNQVKRQSEILFDFMDENKAEFRIKVLGMQTQIGMYGQKHFVAVSEKGAITGDRDKFKDVVVKYDHIPERIKKALPARGLTGLLSLKPKDHKMFSLNELTKLGDLITKNNVSLSPVEDMLKLIASFGKTPKKAIQKKAHKPVIVSGQEPNVESHRDLVCTKCSSKNITVQYGKYGYYFKCGDCEKNSAIKELCCCGTDMKVKKRSNDYSLTCAKCQVDEAIVKDDKLINTATPITPAKTKGFCIRCKVDISFNESAPYCRKCYSSWNRYKNPDYLEKYCHATGIETKTSMKMPVKL